MGTVQQGPGYKPDMYMAALKGGGKSHTVGSSEPGEDPGSATSSWESRNFSVFSLQWV